eukprot:4482739-Pyramimonas_sp.AAC.1
MSAPLRDVLRHDAASHVPAGVHLGHLWAHHGHELVPLSPHEAPLRAMRPELAEVGRGQAA